MVLNGRYSQVLNIVEEAGTRGATWREVAATANLNRGQASGALTNLLNRGDLIKLPTTRLRCVIYLHPNHIEMGEVPADPEAFDRGFALGLSEGATGAREEAMAAGYEDGWREGRIALGRQMGAFLDEMARGIQATFGVGIVVRTGQSWMRHPPHTIEAVRKALERSIGVSLGPVRFTPLPDGIVDLTAQRESRT